MVRLAAEGRRELLERISTFLLDHDLAIGPANLAIAWNVASGASPSLIRRIEEKLREGEKITQEWLDEITAVADEARHDRDARRLLDEFDKSAKLFARSTKAARNVASAYHAQLDRHVVELEGIGIDVDVIDRLASIAREMAERTRKAEAELREREGEAKTLRRRLDKARRDAEQDHLTGLPNRRAFEVEFERQYEQAMAAGEALSIAFCDIDHFKHINDCHGHDAGDRVLKVVARALAESSNDPCHVARHGGEEFVLLFRGLTPPEAKARLDHTREELAARRLFNRETDEPFGQVTFSAGVASVVAQDDPRDALKAADEALYRAKKSGRNQVIAV